MFAQTAVTPAGTSRIAANAHKLAVVDETPAIKRHACSACGVHMVGRVEDAQHQFYGLEFVHPELAVEPGAPAPEFAGFTSSLIEAGVNPAHMTSIRKRLRALGIPAYDAFSPEIMDVIAWHRLKAKTG